MMSFPQLHFFSNATTVTLKDKKGGQVATYTVQTQFKHIRWLIKEVVMVTEMMMMQLQVIYSSIDVLVFFIYTKNPL